MKQKLLFTSGVLQILWSAAAFLSGSISLAVVVFVVSSGGIFPQTPVQPLSALQILFFVFAGLTILIGCGAVLFFGIILVKNNKYKKLATIFSTVILCVPPALGIYSSVKSFMGAMAFVSPMTMLLVAPIVMVIINIIAMVVRQKPSNAV